MQGYLTITPRMDVFMCIYPLWDIPLAFKKKKRALLTTAIVQVHNNTAVWNNS